MQRKFAVSAVILLLMMGIWSAGCSGETKEVPKQCPDGYSLVDGNCFKSCFVDSDCSPGFSCIRLVCIYQGAPTDGDIDQDDTADTNTGCVFDTDCPAGNFCSDSGECKQIPQPDGDAEMELPESGCILDSDCNDGEICTDSHECIVPSDGDVDDDRDTIEIELDYEGPVIAVSPQELSFGNVPVGSSSQKTLRIINSGGADLVINSLTFETSSDEFSVAPQYSLPASLEPAKGMDVIITYTPHDNVEDTNTLLIDSNDPVQNPFRVPITTQIKQVPKIEVTPANVDFGLRSWNYTYTQSITIRNAGNADLAIYDMLWSEGAGGVFGIDSLPATISPSNPYPLGPGEELSFEITFSPTSEGNFSNVLNILSSDPNDYMKSVPVAGEGGVADIEVDPLNLSFSGVPVGSHLDQNVTIRNVGNAPLEQIEISFGPETSDEFSFLTLPPQNLVLQPQEEYVITVHYQPTDEEVDVGSLHILSNDPAEHEVIVRFNGAGSPPDIEVMPTEVHFGVAYPQMPIINQIVWVRNNGEGALFLSGYSLENSGNGVFNIESGPDMNEPIRQGETVAINLSYQPTSDSASSDTLIILSNDPDEEEVRIPIDGEGLHENQCPVADAGTGMQVEPFQTISLDGTNSNDPDGYIIAYEWTLMQHPSDSHASPVPPTSPTPTFTCDVPGSYTFRLRVMDNAFTWSCQDALVTYECVPGETIHIQLVWNTDDVDLDLHLIRPNGTYWDLNDDCFYKTCIPSADNPDPLDWQGLGHPSLDRDDTNGYGPENINLNDPGIGNYKIVVFYYDSHNWPNPATDATVRVFVFGAEAASATVHFDQEHMRWDVFEMQWTGNDAIFQNLGNQPVLDESHGH